MPTHLAAFASERPTPGWAFVRSLGSAHTFLLPEGIAIQAHEDATGYGGKRGKGGQMPPIAFSDYARRAVTQPGGALARGEWRIPRGALKRMRYSSLIDAKIIRAILLVLDRFARPCPAVGRDTGFVIEHKDAWNKNVQFSAARQAELDEESAKLTDILMRGPGDGTDTFRRILHKLADDALTVDSMVFAIGMDEDNLPSSFKWIPGETVQPTWWYLRQYMAEWAERDPLFADWRVAAARRSGELYSEGKAVYDLTDAAYVQIIDNEVVAAFRAAEIAVETLSPPALLDEWPFGMSPLEESISETALFADAMGYQSKLFDPTSPENLLLVSNGLDQEGLNALQSSMLQQYGNAQRLMIVNVGQGENAMRANLLALKPRPTDMLFDRLIDYLVDMKFAAYGATPQLIGWSARGGENVNAERSGEEYEVRNSLDPGVVALMTAIAEMITVRLIQPHSPDMRFRWEGLNAKTPEGLFAQSNVMLENGSISYNEYRAMNNLPPVDATGAPSHYGAYHAGNNAAAVYGSMLNAQAAAQAAAGGGAALNPPGLSAPDGGAAGDFGAAQGLPDAGDDEAASMGGNAAHAPMGVSDA